MLKIDRKTEGNTATVALEGRLDAVSAPELDAELKAALPEITTLVLDLAGLNYISSAGLRVLLKVQKALGGKEHMQVINVNPVIYDIFETTNFDEILAMA